MESDVYKMLQDYEKPISEPKQSGSFRYLQGMLEAGENGKEVGTHGVSQRVPCTSPRPGLRLCAAVGLKPPFSAPAPTKQLLQALPPFHLSEVQKLE